MGYINKRSVVPPTGKKIILRISLAALFAALISAGAFISIPIGPVPIVLQNLIALLAGLILGPFLGGAAVALFLLAGILNLPVFAGGTGGIARLLGPTGGYLAGYFIMAVAAGLIAGRPRKDRKKDSYPRMIIAIIAGLLIVYVPGVYWLKLKAGYDFAKAIGVGFVPFIIGDCIKAAAAICIIPRLRGAAADHLDT
ncbi:MAG: biotin transporter BioY [Treponema sp.]|jgi:biotin transport system substrate-specific component|nr:biotin transporter BioY [Treponema sp.]